MKQFSERDIHELEPGDYWFECAMVSACTPFFDKCEDNHEVEKILRQEKVIVPWNKTDTEMCALVVTFSTKSAGVNFIERLNKFLARAR